VLDTESFLQDVSSEDLLRDRPIPTTAKDGRAIAEVVVRQLEYANAVVLSPPDETAEALARATNPQALIADSVEDIVLHDASESPSHRIAWWKDAGVLQGRNHGRV
jgi:G3E family GTPase